MMYCGPPMEAVTSIVSMHAAESEARGKGVCVQAQAASATAAPAVSDAASTAPPSTSVLGDDEQRSNSAGNGAVAPPAAPHPVQPTVAAEPEQSLVRFGVSCCIVLYCTVSVCVVGLFLNHNHDQNRYVTLCGACSTKPGCGA
jgi:hypothetical protein